MYVMEFVCPRSFSVFYFIPCCFASRHFGAWSNFQTRLLCVVCSAQVIERAAELDIYLPKVLVKMVSECLFGKIPSDWDQSPELGGAGAGGW